MHEDEKNVINKQTGRQVNIGKKRRRKNNPTDNLVLSLPMHKDEDY